MIASEWFGTMLSEFTASALLLVAGYFVGGQRERRRLRGKALHEYDFYPYVSTPEKFAEFSLKDFRLGVHFLLRNTDMRAARQLIFIGEQNNVRQQLSAEDLRAYERLFGRCHGKSVTDDSREFLENYRNLARLVGRTFPHMGIEVLVHDLSNPSRSITCIESGEVTGRALEMGTTTLLVDLMRRVNQNQDKLNYELNIGARRFKCTTIPILRKDYGVVGAICINIDTNYISDYVLESAERTAEFFRLYCKTDMKLDENILSKDEYRLALQGKRHLRDSRAAGS
ncbi:MAG TPA: PAS domain-containing protein [Steroidobacteraceae bacterium]|jgi:predicted transcriptional regulator YheO|nr:PAS domain-containing protein [Steroidobacteraceae bacterium]